MRNANGFKLTLVAALIIICLIAVAFVYGITQHGLDNNSTPLVVSALGFLSTAIGVVAALLGVQRVEHKTDTVDKKVNGHITRLTDALVEHGVTSEEMPPAPPDLQTPDANG